MSNLVQIVSQIFGAQIVARAAQTLGLNPALAHSLASIAVPSVLHTLADLAGQTDGARRIAEQVQNQDNNLLGALVGAVSGQNTASFLATGNGMLASLGIDPAAVAADVARAGGVEAAPAQQVVGLVTPAIFGALGQQDPQIWSSGEGIAGLFARERAAIAAAMPATADRPRAAPVAAPAPSMSHDIPAAAAVVGPAAQAAAGGIPTWAKLLVPLIVLTFLMWYFKPASPPAPAPVGQTAPTSSPAPTAAATHLATELAAFAQKTNIVIAKATAALADITTAEQAGAAVAGLDGLAADFTAAAETFGKLPEVARRELAAPMQAILAGVRAQTARVRAIAGTEPLRPALDRIEAAINGFKV